jgi:hypothetical protein
VPTPSRSLNPQQHQRPGKAASTKTKTTPMNLAASARSEKRPTVAPRVFSEGLGRQLPAHLTNLDARARIGVLLDAKRVRLLLDRDGHVVVAQRSP